MNIRRWLALGAVGVAIMGLWLPGGLRAEADVLGGVIVPVVLWRMTFAKMKSFSVSGSIGAGIVIVLACWALVTLGLLAVGAPVGRLTAALTLLVVNLLACFSYDVWSPAHPRSGQSGSYGAGHAIESVVSLTSRVLSIARPADRAAPASLC